MPISVSALKDLADTLMRSGADMRTVLDAVFSALEGQEHADTEAARQKRLDKRSVNKTYKREQRLRDAVATGAVTPAQVTAAYTAATTPNLFDIAYDNGATDAPPRDVRPDRVSDVRHVRPDNADAPSPSLSSSSSPVVVGVVGVVAREADANELISAQALALAEQIFDILGVDREFTPPGWCGTAMYLQGGLSSGWRPEIVLIAARTVAAQLRERGAALPRGFRYLTPPIKDAHAEHARQFSMVGGIVSNKKEQAHGGNSKSRTQGRGVAAACLDRLQRLADERGLQADRAEPREGGAGDGSGGYPDRELSPRRSGAA